MSEREVFREAYLEHKDRLLTLTVALVGQQSAAEDVVHDVFCSLMSENGRLSDKEKLLPFLAKCARNRALNLLRKHKRETLMPLNASGAEASPHAAAVARESRERVLAAMAALPMHLREVVSLRIWIEMTFEDIAQLQDISKSTAHERYQQALEMVRRFFVKGTSI